MLKYCLQFLGKDELGIYSMDQNNIDTEDFKGRYTLSVKLSDFTVWPRELSPVTYLSEKNVSKVCVRKNINTADFISKHFLCKFYGFVDYYATANTPYIS